MSEQSDGPDLPLQLPHRLRPTDEWREDRFLVFDALNRGRYMANAAFRFRQEDREMQIRMGLFPGLLTRVVLPLRMLDSQVVIPGRTPHRFKCVCSGGPLDPRRLTGARLVGTTVLEESDVRISEPRLCDEPPENWPQADRPVADELHQWRGRDWPGKTRGLDEMRTRLRREMEKEAPEPPADRSRWGGWKQKRFDATGFFHTRHDGGRWWLVDPDGCAFYSIGVDCVRPHVRVETRGNEDLFEALPPADEGDPELWSFGEDSRLFNALAHNLRRALGEGWLDHWRELSRRRLLEWGFNTVGNWSEREFCRTGRVPYVWPLRGFPATSRLIFRDFPDVFSEEYRRNSQRFARQLQDFRGDPWLIGYFLRNEPHWAFGHYDLARRMLLTREPLASRGDFAGWLKERYGNVEALNRAWGTPLEGFQHVAEGGLPEPQLRSSAVRRDTREFTRRMIAEYVRVPSEACREVDPEHLNLGVRYAWIAHEDLLAGAEVFDVFSINGYQGRPPEADIRRCAEAAEAPVMVGEFHTGALDRGLPWGGLRQVRTQRERADSYRFYVEQGAAIPELVGAHYFLWNDQHVVGRYDGENWQIGLIDICQKPYEEMVRAARRSHERIYRVAAGQGEPFDELPEELELREGGPKA